MTSRKLTVQEIRQQLTEIARALHEMTLDETRSEHDRHAIKHAELTVDSARTHLFGCESQS